MDGTAVWHLSKGEYPQGGRGQEIFMRMENFCR